MFFHHLQPWNQGWSSKSSILKLQFESCANAKFESHLTPWMNNFRKSQHRKQEHLMIDLPCINYIDNLTKLQQSCGIQIVAIWAPWNPSIHNIVFAYVPNKSLFWVFLFLWSSKYFLEAFPDQECFMFWILLH